jgi:two-component system sensor histidine kinase HydH
MQQSSRNTSSTFSSAKPLLTAAIAALVYMVVCVFYIILSSRYAASVAVDPKDLQLIETIKGIAFVLTTSVLLFAGAYLHFLKILRHERTIAMQELALLKAERRMMGALSFAIVAHDLNNLLMPMSAILRDLRERETERPSLRHTCRELETGFNSLSHLCKRISSSTSLVLPDKEEYLTLDEALPKLVAIASRHPDVRSCSVSIVEMPTLAIITNRILLEEALMNLLINAAQATGKSGKIEVRVRTEGDTVLIAVHDNGPGVPDDQKEAIFDPCFTTKPGGTGLGLVAVRAFAELCGGDVSVGKSPLGGALFTLRFPLKTNESKPRG